MVATISIKTSGNCNEFADAISYQYRKTIKEHDDHCGARACPIYLIASAPSFSANPFELTLFERS